MIMFIRFSFKKPVNWSTSWKRPALLQVPELELHRLMSERVRADRLEEEVALLSEVQRLKELLDSQRAEACQSSHYFWLHFIPDVVLQQTKS